MPPERGIAKMQSLNAAILNPLFGLVFLGTTVLCVFLAVTAPSTSNRPGSALRLTGAILFLVGTIIVTFVVNVPLNDALAKLTPSSSAAASFWQQYQSQWTAWNHLRAVAAVGATVALALAFRLQSRPAVIWTSHIAVRGG